MFTFILLNSRHKFLNISQHSCECPLGFEGDRCQTVTDWCALLGDNPCSGNGVCLNLPDTHKCSCNRGWGGEDCSLDVDECASKLDDCNQNQICISLFFVESCCNIFLYEFVEHLKQNYWKCLKMYIFVFTKF